MATKNITVETPHSVVDFLNAVENPSKREDCLKITAMITRETGLEPRMWGTAIVGFGSYHYQYESGHSGDAPLIGLSPRKNAISLYLASDFPGKEDLLKNFGKHKTGKACIYINKLVDIDPEIFKQMINASVAYMKQKYC
ncbi:MAG: DUF1801 domain-containing protein [Bacteroidota bacterium]